MARKAYTAVVQEGGFGLGLATENESGYHPVKRYPPGAFKTWKDASEKAQSMNVDEFGITREEAWKIAASSMFARGN